MFNNWKVRQSLSNVIEEDNIVGDNEKPIPSSPLAISTLVLRLGRPNWLPFVTFKSWN